MAAIVKKAGTNPERKINMYASGKEAFLKIDEDLWLGAEPDTPSHFARELKADIIVAGGGLAGVAAVRTAIEAGACVVMFEKSGNLGGRSGDFSAFGSKQWAKHFPSCDKYNVSKWDIVKGVSKGCLSRIKEDILSRWADLNGEALDWFIDAVPEDMLFYASEDNNVKPSEYKYGVVARNFPYPKHFHPAQEYSPCYPGTAMLLPGGLSFIKANLEKAIDAGGNRLSCFFGTPAIKLLTEAGRVVGLIAKDSDGNYYKATADKGVILATGDFLSDDAMVKRFIPKVYLNGFRADGSGKGRNLYAPRDKNGVPCNTGDGHKMGMRIGAMMQQDGCAMSHHMGGVVGTCPFLLLDSGGNRFMNEDIQGGPLGQRVGETKGTKAFQFFDSNVLEQLPYMPYGHGKITNVTSEALEASVESGKAIMGGTLDELMDKLDIDKTGALASINRYNKLCKKGSDDDFGKTARRMFPIENPPYYCVPWGKDDSLVTVSGLESDKDCRVYDSNFNIIPGLYVAGNTQGNRFALDYPETTLGLSHSLALVYGRVAAQNAIAGI